jgi:hypothetical protein
MKVFASISLLALFAYIQLFNGMIWMSYEINKSEIIQQFCENIDKPEKKCEGTCHMKKMMLTEDAEEESDAAITIPQIQLFVEEIKLGLNKSELETNFISIYQNDYVSKILDQRDIPPKA